MLNILITSVGRRAYMVDFFRKTLKNKGKVHACNSEMTFALQKADKHFITPNIYDTSYIEILLDYCKKNKINAILSLFDIDLPVLAKHKEDFEKIGVQLLVSDYEFVITCNDKWKSHLFVIQNGFNSPKTFKKLKNVKAALQNKELIFPLIIKPRWGMGSIGIFEAENEMELDVFYNKVKRTIQKTYLKYESEQNLDESIIIQEKIKGEEWGIDIFNNLNSNFLAAVPKHKLAMRSGETDIAITSKRKDLIEMGKRIANATKHIGNLDTDIFIRDNKVYILEFNARFGGQYPFTHISGTDFPEALIQLIEGKKEPNPNLFEYRETKGFKDIEVRKVNNL